MKIGESEGENPRGMLNQLRHLWLKYLVGYTNQQNYWNGRWKFERSWTPQMKKDHYQEILDVMTKLKCTNILEVGCGEAELKRLPGYLGLDFSLGALKRSGLEQFIYADITRTIPLPDKSMDSVLSMAVLMHIPFEKVERATKEISRVAKKCVILKEHWGPRPDHTQPHSYTHNLPALFEEYFDGDLILLNAK